MRKYFLIIFIIFITSTAYSNELWNGLKIGMSLNEAKSVLEYRIGAVDVSSIFVQRIGLRNSPILDGSQNYKKNCYILVSLRASNNSYWQRGSDSPNIFLYHNEKNIVIGIRVYWAASFESLLQTTRNNFGNEIYEGQIPGGKYKYFLWDDGHRIIQLSETATGTGYMVFLDQDWHYENSFDIKGEHNSGIVF